VESPCPRSGRDSCLHPPLPPPAFRSTIRKSNIPHFYGLSLVAMLRGFSPIPFLLFVLNSASVTPCAPLHFRVLVVIDGLFSLDAFVPLAPLCPSLAKLSLYSLYPWLVTLARTPCPFPFLSLSKGGDFPPPATVIRGTPSKPHLLPLPRPLFLLMLPLFGFT